MRVDDVGRTVSLSGIIIVGNIRKRRQLNSFCRSKMEVIPMAMSPELAKMFKEQSKKMSALEELQLALDAVVLVGVVRVGLAARNGGPFAGELGVERDEFLLILSLKSFTVPSGVT